MCVDMDKNDTSTLHYLFICLYELWYRLQLKIKLLPIQYFSSRNILSIIIHELQISIVEICRYSRNLSKYTMSSLLTYGFKGNFSLVFHCKL